MPDEVSTLDWVLFAGKLLDVLDAEPSTSKRSVYSCQMDREVLKGC